MARHHVAPSLSRRCYRRRAVFSRSRCVAAIFVVWSPSSTAGDGDDVQVNNHRVTRWPPRTAEGEVVAVVAGGRGSGGGCHQLAGPIGVVIDDASNLYVVENHNHRVSRWALGASAGDIVAGGQGEGDHENQLRYPMGVFVA